jgi:hypothetical protein
MKDFRACHDKVMMTPLLQRAILLQKNVLSFYCCTLNGVTESVHRISSQGHCFWLVLLFIIVLVLFIQKNLFEQGKQKQRQEQQSPPTNDSCQNRGGGEITQA